MGKCNEYFCTLCSCFIFGGNGLREHNRSKKHVSALETMRNSGGYTSFNDLLK